LVDACGEFFSSAVAIDISSFAIASDFIKKLEGELGRPLTSEEKIAVYKLVKAGKGYERIVSIFKRKEFENDRAEGLEI